MALTAAQKAARRRRRQEQRRQARLNPLNAPFKTPAQLRAEAQRMAELSVTPEETLREEQRKQEAGLGAVTGTAAGVLGGYQQQVAGGLGGLASMYQNLAGQARGAGGEALAAAGVSPSDVPAASAAVPAQFANLAALTSGYVPAAVATGQRLIGESKAGLSRALAERSSALSQNMGKFLQDLQQQEYEKAVAREASAQNAARLGLAEREYETDVAFRSEELDLKRQGLALDAQKILAGIEKESIKAAAKVAGENQKKRTKIKSVQDQILARSKELFAPAEYATGKNSWTVNYVIPASGPVNQPKTGSVDIEAGSEQDAIEKFSSNSAYAGFTPASATRGAGTTIVRPPTRREVLRSLVKELVNAGMAPDAARRWVNARALPRLKNLTGAFAGGVGGG